MSPIRAKWLTATSLAVLSLPGCVTQGAPSAAVPAATASGSPSPDASPAVARSPQSGSSVRYGTGQATIQGRVTYVPGTGGAASARVGILGPDNREEWVTADIDGRYAFTGVDLGKDYMLTFSSHFATVPTSTPVVRNVISIPL